MHIEQTKLIIYVRTLNRYQYYRKHSSVGHSSVGVETAMPTLCGGYNCSLLGCSCGHGLLGCGLPGESNRSHESYYEAIGIRRYRAIVTFLTCPYVTVALHLRSFWVIRPTLFPFFFQLRQRAHQPWVCKKQKVHRDSPVFQNGGMYALF